MKTSLLSSIDSHGVCWDYSFWNENNSDRCSQGQIRFKRTHPILCNRTYLNCNHTLSNSDPFEYCPNSSTFEECHRPGRVNSYFFCKISKTCIPECKMKEILWSEDIF